MQCFLYHLARSLWTSYNVSFAPANASIWPSTLAWTEISRPHPPIRFTHSPLTMKKNYWSLKLQEHRQHFTPKPQTTPKEALQLIDQLLMMELREEEVNILARMSFRLKQVMISGLKLKAVEDFFQSPR